MIEQHEVRIQICCDTCPASTPESFPAHSFREMVEEAKKAGWLVRPVKPKPAEEDTASLFGSAPRVAGKPQQKFTHNCPSCAKLQSNQRVERRR